MWKICRLTRSYCISLYLEVKAIAHAYLIKDIKEAAHAMILREKKLFIKFPGGQVGCSGFTYHISSKKSLINYVKNQDEHHKTESFKD
jgi:putative transposase